MHPFVNLPRRALQAVLSVALVPFILTCSREVEPVPDMKQRHCVRLQIRDLGLVEQAGSREEALESVEGAVKSWSFARKQIPTMTWDVDQGELVAEVQGYSCVRAAALIKNILGEEFTTESYMCESCEWLLSNP